MDSDKPAKPSRFPSKLRLFSRHSFGMEFSRILTLFNEDMFQVKKAHLRGGARERKLAARAGEAGSKHGGGGCSFDISILCVRAGGPGPLLTQIRRYSKPFFEGLVFPPQWVRVLGCGYR